MTPSVVALLVSHDGARWLPQVIEGLAAQTVAPARVVAVDTTSRDESPDLLRAAYGELVETSGRTSYPEAVALGLERVGDAEWIWLLHDDSTPAPDALEALLAAAAADPEADVLGPKLREWPSLKRLLEVGVTISGTGRRETGLEYGEYDQGQHDEVETVLAVNTAGMLVRRSVLERLGGFDPQLPIFGNDIDFGWRAAAAGYRTIVVPQAVVFHAEAAHRGTRRTPLTGRHTHYQERRAALYTLLANAPRRTVWWQVVRLFFGTLLRMVGFLLVRQPGQSLDDLAALVSLYRRPGQVAAARRSRAAALTSEPVDVRPLLAPWWLPYRHGLDFVSDLANAATRQAQDVAERRRAAKAAANPVPVTVQRRHMVDEEDEAYADTGLVARFFTNPIALAMAVFVVLAVVGAREAFGGVSGGGLSPAPATPADLWRLYTESWHPLAQGTPIPAPAYLLPVALLASLLGSATAAVSALLLLAVPLSIWGAWRFLKVVGRLVDTAGSPRWLVALGAATYALVPVVSGAWGNGRLGTVVITVLLPWLAHAALGFADPEADRRWRAAWRTGFLLAVVTAFAPVSWFVTVGIGVVIVVLALFLAPAVLRDRSVWGPPAVAAGVVPVLLAPWWIPAVWHHGSALLLLDTGRPPYPVLGFQDLLAGRYPGDLGAPWWLGLLVVVLAVAALVPRATRIPVLVVWLVALVAAVVAVVLGQVTLQLPVGTAHPGQSFLLVLLRGAFVVAAFIGAQGLVTLLRRSATRGRQLLLLVLAAVSAVVPAIGLVWFVVQGPGTLSDQRDTGIPEYMQQKSLEGSQNGILVIRGSLADGLSYVVRRDDGATLGDDEILTVTPVDARFNQDVQELVSRPTSRVVSDLADSGIQYVVLPSPADGNVSAGLDGVSGLIQASAEDRSTRAWQVNRQIDPAAVDGPGSPLRVTLLVIQGLAIVVVLVLCVPTRRREEGVES